MKKSILTFVLTFYVALLCLLTTVTAFSFGTKTLIPEPVPVEDREKYKCLVLQSDLVRALTDWSLVEVGVPKRLENHLWPVYVMLKYDLPRFYSRQGIQYHVPLEFKINFDTLSNLSELWDLTRNMRAEVETFESNLAVQLFLREHGVKEIYRRGHTFRTSITDSNYICYDFITDSVETFWFRNRNLIDSLALFLPPTAPHERIQEFKQNVGVDLVVKKRGTLQILGDQLIKKSCMGRFTYSYSMAVVTGFTLPNGFAWVSFPVVAKAHKAISENLLRGDLSDCRIDEDRGHSYTYGSFNSGHQPFYSITVVLKCGVRNKRGYASLRLFSNGAYDRLKIKREYH